MYKLIRITTVPISLKILLKGQLKYMSKYFKVIGVSSFGKELNEIEIDEGIPVFVVEMSRKITPILDIISVIKLYKLLKYERPTIIHSHTPKAGIIGMLAGWLAGVPLRLHTVAGLPLMESTGLKHFVLKLVEKLTYFFSTNVYSNSFELYRYIVSNNFCNPDKIKVLAHGSSNGIDLSFFDRATISKDEISELNIKFDIREEDLVFIFIGRLVSDKGINELVVSFDNISQDYLNCKLLLVGSFEDDLDPLKDSTLTLIKNNKKIFPVGFQDDVRPFLSIADVLVFPSYREGFPNVVMQAGAMEVPAIVTNINGCNEIIEHGKNGIIVPLKEQKSLERAMLKMINEKEYRLSLRRNARAMICNRYGQQIVWDSILKEYQSLLQNIKGI